MTLQRACGFDRKHRIARMQVDVAGPDNGPDLVLLHGGIGTGEYHWSKLADPLRETYRAHLPDLPGHGPTPLPEDGSYSRDVLVEAVEEYLNGLDHPVHVAGSSWAATRCSCSPSPGPICSPPSC
jgi:pimeloyl-ACP methyl ester carboxylesterase